VETTAAAVAGGRLSEEEARGSGYRELPVSHDLAPPEMAVRAGQVALERAGVPAAGLDLVAHAWTHHQGHDFWSPAHFVAARLGAGKAQPVGVHQMCNGGAAAVETAASRLLADPTLHRALVTTADRFGAPGFDRWRGDYSVVYGDGATAAVLDVVTAPVTSGLELLALSTVAAPELEWMHRGDDAFSPAARMPSPTIDVRRTKKAYLTATGKDAFVKTVATCVGDVLVQGLAEAGVTVREPRCVLVPRLGAAALDEVYRPAVNAVLPAPVADLGERTGHLGAGDALANLTALAEQELLRPGELGVVLSAGAGFTWSCLVVRRPARYGRDFT
jgi:3-oxoacyl-[acyl-carrier-protein] synthase-3